MKTKIIYRFISFIPLITILYWSASGQVSSIYAVEKINEDTSYVSIYNYETQEYQILFKLSPLVRPTNYSVTFDPYRKIIYYMNSTGPCGGPKKWNVYSVDLTSQIRKKEFVIENDISVLDFQYDFFSNNLIIRDNDSISFYSVDGPVLNTVVSIPPGQTLLYMPQNEVYNTVGRSYLYYTTLVNGERNSVYVSIDSNEFVCNSNTLQDWPLTPVVNPETNQFYGVSKEKNDSSFIIRINPQTGAFTELAMMPDDYVGSNSYGLFDSRNTKFISAYYTVNITEYKFAIYDIETDSMYTTPCRFSQSYLFMDYDPLPILKIVDDKLVGSVSDNYVWFCNDTLLANVITRSHKPEKTGSYKFSTTRPDGGVVYSNEVFIEVSTFINNYENKDSFSIFPNPGSGKFTIKNSGKIDQLEIFNLNGVPVYKNHSGILKDANPAIDISYVDKGIYFIRIICDKEISLQKVMVYD